MIRRFAFALYLLACTSGCAHTNSATNAGVVNAPESAENHNAAAMKLLEELQTEAMMQRTMDLYLESQMKANPMLRQFEDIMRSFLREHLGWEGLKDEFVKLYVTHFTQRELEELFAFYQTPIGIKSATLIPEMATAGAAIGQRRVQAHMGDLHQRIRARLKELQGSQPKPPAEEIQPEK